MAGLSQLPEQFNELSLQFNELALQFSQLRTDVRADISAVRSEMAGMRSELRGEMAEMRTDLTAAIVAGDDRVLTQMRVLHEDVIARFALLGEARRPKPRGLKGSTQ